MRIFGSENECFVGSPENPDMGIDEAQLRASTLNEDQDEDPETSKEEIAAIYAMSGMDPSAWED